MLKVGDVFEYEGRHWVVLQAHSGEIKYDMFTLRGETEYFYKAVKLSKKGKQLKSYWGFSSVSGAEHWVPRNIKSVGRAKVEYIVSDVNLTDF